jgi:hypothetical protein
MKKRISGLSPPKSNLRNCDLRKKSLKKVPVFTRPYHTLFLVVEAARFIYDRLPYGYFIKNATVIGLFRSIFS